MRTERQDQRMRFLRNRVIPFLEKMPTCEQFGSVTLEADEDALHDWQEGGCHIEDFDLETPGIGSMHSDAVLDFTVYHDGRRRAEEGNECKISAKYDCGYTGCLAGWYYLMAEQEKVEEPGDLDYVKHFNLGPIATHFGITYGEASGLFQSLGKGVEGMEDFEDNFDEDGIYEGPQEMTKLALEARKEFLDELFTQYSIDTAGS